LREVCSSNWLHETAKKKARQKQTCPDRFHSRTLKAGENSAMVPRHETPQGHGGAREFFIFVHDLPRGRPFGGGGTHRTLREAGRFIHTVFLQFVKSRISP